MLRRGLIVDLSIALGESYGTGWAGGRGLLLAETAPHAASQPASLPEVSRAQGLTSAAGLGFAMGNVFWYDWHAVEMRRAPDDPCRTVSNTPSAGTASTCRERTPGTPTTRSSRTREHPRSSKDDEGHGDTGMRRTAGACTYGQGTPVGTIETEFGGRVVSIGIDEACNGRGASTMVDEVRTGHMYLLNSRLPVPCATFHHTLPPGLQRPRNAPCWFLGLPFVLVVATQDLKLRGREKTRNSQAKVSRNFEWGLGSSAFLAWKSVAKPDFLMLKTFLIIPVERQAC